MNNHSQPPVLHRRIGMIRIGPRTHTPKPHLNVPALVGGSVATLLGLGWAGLQVPPAPFPPVPASPVPPATVPIPAGLPTPVERWYHQIYGEQVPVIRSAVISGRGTMRPVGGVSLPARFRFTHDAGHNYRHYFETTVWGVPLLRANEYFVDGRGRMELPWGVDEGAQIDQSANLSLWGEAFWLPAILLTDARVHWERIDAHTALLVVPWGTMEERFVVRFDPATRMPWLLESMRYKGAAATGKTLWFNELRAWTSVNGYVLPTTTAVTWADEGTPWLRLTTEHVVYNVNVDTSQAAKGP